MSIINPLLEMKVQLISLLQNSNLMPHTQPTNALQSSNKIYTYSDRKPNETLGIYYISSITCSSYFDSSFWLID